MFVLLIVSAVEERNRISDRQRQIQRYRDILRSRHKPQTQDRAREIYMPE